MAAYGTDAGIQAWLDANGHVLPANAPSPAILRERGSAYIDATYEPMLSCSSRAGGIGQDLAWPRTGHIVSGEVVAGVPQPWVNASYRAAWLEAVTPGWASGSIDLNRLVKRQKVEGLEREFFSPSDVRGDKGSSGNVDSKIAGMIALLLCPAPAYEPAILVV